MTGDESRAERIRRGRLGVLEALALAGLPATALGEVVASAAVSQDVTTDELLARVGAHHDPAAAFEAMTRA